MARSGGFWAGLVFGGAAVGAVVATGFFVANNDPVSHDGSCRVTLDGETYARTAEAATTPLWLPQERSSSTWGPSPRPSAWPPRFRSPDCAISTMETATL